MLKVFQSFDPLFFYGIGIVYCDLERQAFYRFPCAPSRTTNASPRASLPLLWDSYRIPMRSRSWAMRDGLKPTEERLHAFPLRRPPRERRNVFDLCERRMIASRKAAGSALVVLGERIGELA